MSNSIRFNDKKSSSGLSKTGLPKSGLYWKKAYKSGLSKIISYFKLHTSVMCPRVHIQNLDSSQTSPWILKITIWRVRHSYTYPSVSIIASNQVHAHKLQLFFKKLWHNKYSSWYLKNSLTPSLSSLHALNY